jgi:ketosteroid isomerase-like protein
MSKENVELVRRIHDGWSRGDFSVGASLCAPEFEWHQHAEAVEPGSHRGTAVGGAIRRIFEVYEHFRVEPEEYIDAGEDKVVVTARIHATGRGSGVDVEQGFAFVWTVHRGKATELSVFTDRREALDAAGYREQ